MLNEQIHDLVGRLIMDAPHKNAKADPVRHHRIAIVKEIQTNGVDGSGPWLGVHLLGENSEFIQGGWILDPAIKQ